MNGDQKSVPLHPPVETNIAQRCCELRDHTHGSSPVLRMNATNRGSLFIESKD